MSLPIDQRQVNIRRVGIRQQNLYLSQTAQSTTTPRHVYYRASQLCIGPKLVDPGFLYGEREEEEQKPASSPSRKRKTLTREEGGHPKPEEEGQEHPRKP